MSLKICYIAYPSSLHTQRWLSYFVRRGHDVHLIAVGGGAQAKLDGVIIEGVLGMVPIRHPLWLPLFAANLIRVRRILEKVRPDLVHAHFVEICGWLGALSGFHPFVLTAWGSDVLVLPGASRTGIGRILTRHAIGRADLVTAASRDLIRHVANVGGSYSRSRVVRWGVDLDRFRPDVDCAWLRQRLDLGCSPVVFSPRRFEALYNIDTILQAIPRVLRERPSVKFVLANDGGKDEAGVRELVGRLGIGQAVRLVGRIPHGDMPSYFVLSDVMVSVPSSDVIPVCMLEAMACGAVPVISDLPGPKEWVRDGRNGLVVPVGDSGKLADAIIRILKDPTLRERMRTYNFRLVERRADHSRWMAKMEALYSSLRGSCAWKMGYGRIRTSHTDFSLSKRGFQGLSSVKAKPKTVVFLENRGDFFGGGQFSGFYLLSALDKRRFVPILICPHQGSLTEKARACNIQVEVFSFPHISVCNGLRDFTALISFHTLLEKLDPSIIHSNVSASRESIFGAIEARRLGIPFVWHVRVSERVPLMDRFLAACSSRIIVVSEQVRKRFDRLSVRARRKIFVVYNGVRLDAFRSCPLPTAIKQRLSISPSAPIIGTMGRLIWFKGQDVFLECASRVAKAYPDAVFVLIGEDRAGVPSYGKKLQRLSHDLGISDRCLFLGFRQDIPELLTMMDVFVSLPHFDSFGRVVLEAMAAGVPVVATDVGGIRAAIQDGISGYLVPPRAPKAAADRVVTLLRNKTKAREIGDRGKQRAEHAFSIETHARNVEALYREALVRNGTCGSAWM